LETSKTYLKQLRPPFEAHRHFGSNYLMPWTKMKPRKVSF
jgi:hypothetical protein